MYISVILLLSTGIADFNFNMATNESASTPEEGSRVIKHSKNERIALFGSGDAYSASIMLQQEDLRIWRERKAAEEAAKLEAGHVDDPDDADFVRPTTPPQGTNYNAWTSYRSLPRDHPVFGYDDRWRAKQYGKGVDAVLKAEYDKVRFGNMGGDDKSAKCFAERLKRTLGLVNGAMLSAIS